MLVRLSPPFLKKNRYIRRRPTWKLRLDHLHARDEQSTHYEQKIRTVTFAYDEKVTHAHAHIEVLERTLAATRSARPEVRSS